MEPTLFDRLLANAAAERQRAEDGLRVVTREGSTEEMTPMGRLRWYLHDELTEPTTRALYFYELEIPPGSRSGKLVCQGQVIHFVLTGAGSTIVDGVAHEWESGDLIGIPPKEDGVTYQHFNTSDEAVRMVVAWPNLDSALGPEAGVQLRVVEPCPEWAGAAESSPS